MSYDVQILPLRRLWRTTEMPQKRTFPSCNLRSHCRPATDLQHDVERRPECRWTVQL